MLFRATRRRLGISVSPIGLCLGIVLSRSYLSPGDKPRLPGDPLAESDTDALTISIAGEGSSTRGCPASRNHEAYIWSLGANDISDQPRYDPTHQYAPPARQHYRSDAPVEYLGGGDDINNWDRNQGFMRFYN